MSSKFKVLSIALVALLALFGYTTATQASVTGSFSTTISFEEVEPPSELVTPVIDFENDVNITVAISGLTSTLHTHFGLAGLEDIILTTEATLGALDVTSELVFGRFAGVCGFPGALIGVPESCFLVVNNTVPVSTELLFIKKRVTSGITFGGVSFENLAMFEDVTFPETLSPVSYGASDQNFAFGDVLMLEGQTPSGITVRAETGICAEQDPNVIKKHAFDFQVNPACGGFGDIAVANSFELEQSASQSVDDNSATFDVTETLTEETDAGPTANGVDVGDVWRKTLTFNGGGVGAVSAVYELTIGGDLDSGDLSTTSCSDLDDGLVNDGDSCTFDITIPAGFESGSVDFSLETEDELLKPFLFFDFEKIFITGVPIASGVTGSTSVVCERVDDCELTQTITFSGGVIPFSTSFSFVDLLSLDFGGATLTFSTGVGELEVAFLADGTIGAVSIDLETTLNPDNNPATLEVSGSITPGVGLETAGVDLTVERSGVEFSAGADFTGGPPATFDDATFSISTTAGAVDLTTTATFTATGFGGASVTGTVTF